MAVIRWTIESEMWLRDIHEYISRDNPSAAARVVKSIYDKVQILRDLPEIGYRYRTERVKLILVAGQNGSGKTTITAKLLRREWMQECQYINPDLIAQQEFGDWNSPVAVSILKDF